MGYYSTIRGAINIDPPLSWNEFKDDITGDNNLFEFFIDEEEINTPEGVLTRKSALEIISSHDSGVKAYEAISDLLTLVEVCKGHKLTGEFRIVGENAGDISRMFVDDGYQVVVWQPKIVWPDGLIEEPRR